MRLVMAEPGGEEAPGGTPQKVTQPRLPSLDGARALSIALVVLGHAGAVLPDDDWQIKLFLRDHGGADLGVSIFFVLSGYLITRLLLNEEAARGTISLRAFYVRRAFRILPAIYAYIVFLAIMDRVGLLTVTRQDFIAAATFTWNYHGGDPHWLGHTWSLSVEEQFYVCWPLILVVAGQRRALKIALAVIALEPFVRVGWYLAFPADRPFIPVMGHTRIDVLLAGCVLALVEQSPVGAAWLTRNVTSRRAVAVLVLLLLNVALIQHLHGAYLLPVGYSIAEVSIAVLLFWAMRHTEGPIGRMLNAGPSRWLGRLSYSLYVWQQFFVLGGGWIPRIFPFPINVLTAVAVASLSYYLIEKPFLRVRDRVLA
jgi:peptidoglycan/LPS O-acetylase OafA/YrhL